MDISLLRVVIFARCYGSSFLEKDLDYPCKPTWRELRNEEVHHTS